MAKKKGIPQGPVPTDPTGRLVIQPHTKGQAVHTAHWCPKEGTRWTCPGCGLEFVRDEDRRGEPWRVINPVAQAGRIA